MTFHSRSVVEFGRFYSRISESLLSSAPLAATLEIVREQLDASAAVLQIEDRWSGNQPMTVVVEDGAPSEVPATRLAELLETTHRISASRSSESNGRRYTLWLFRDLSDISFDAEESSVCEIVAGEMQRGLELSARIGTSEVERTLYSTVMDRLAVGVVILGAGGSILCCSRKAEEALSERDGLQLQAGRLRATCAKEDRDLQAAIRAAIQAATGGQRTTRGIALTRLSGHRNLGLVIQSMPAPNRNGAIAAPTVAIFLRDPEANCEVEGDLVRELFDLTPAEAAVARRLAAGLSLEDAASSLDISRNTARAHLRSIFSKSGITRQTELVRLMLNSAVVLGERPRQVA